jgi:hypothetical protein
LAAQGCERGELTQAPEAASPVDDRPAWDRFEEQRTQHLAALGEPVEACIKQEDTQHAAFRGCYDWHSAVHAAWALFALARLEGDARWAAAANAQLDYAAIDGTRAQIESGGLDGENPYGFAWFLLMAIERERATGSNDTRAVGGIVSDRLLRHLESLQDFNWQSSLGSDDYDNASWALLNLWRYAQYSGDAQTQAKAEQMARKRLLAEDGACSLRAESYFEDNFFSPCLMRVHAMAQMLPADEVRPWIQHFIGRDVEIQPVTFIERPHPGGLNFSRAWGLWDLYRVTGDETWRDAYVDHVTKHLSMPQYWREDYAKYSHWVPQFGIYAIALSYHQP